MGSPVLHPLDAEPADAVCRDLDLEEASRQLLVEGMSASDFVWVLRKKKFCLDALKLLAHAMPAREAVWWGCCCIRSVLKKTADPVAADAVEMAERWVQDQSEENRLAAAPIAEGANHSGQAGLVAMAVLHSLDRQAPDQAEPDQSEPDQAEPDQAEPDQAGRDTEARPALTGGAVFGILMLTVAAEKPRFLQRRYRTLLDQGIEILARGIRS